MMRKNRKHKFLVRTYMGGRLPKLPEGDGGGATGDSQQQGNNTGVTQPPAGGDSNQQNNDGQTLDLTQFWQDPEAEGNQDQNRQQQDGDSEDIGKTLVTEIGQYNPGALFTPEIAKEISEGNLDGANKAFATMMQGTLRQAIVMSARIMQRFEQSIQGQIQQSIQSNQTAVGDEQLLKDSFPSFKNPATQPMIRGVFNQALKNCKGDRTKAVEQAKGFLRAMAPAGGDDFGFTPPRNPEDNYMGDSSKSLIEDLLGMKG